MRFFNQLMNFAGDLVMRPWPGASPWVGLTFASLLTAALMVFVFRLTSNQAAVRRTRNRLLARTLELLLFRHSLPVSLSACGRILAEDARYLATLLRPMLVGIVPIVLIFVQMSAWLEARPFAVGESIVLDVELDPGTPILSTSVTLILPGQVRIDSDPVRIPSQNSISWRLKAVDPGASDLRVHVADADASKSVAVGDSFVRVSPQRARRGFWSSLLSPSEASLPADGPITRIALNYPSRTLSIGLHDIHWTIAAIVLMMAFGLALGRIFGVRLA
ncbi:MAG: hypothetical protein IT428_08685 [Planctomycetaceae bacterium]|nr:hypothetical protein [Planctomycetaceae bacterium]